MPHSQSLESLMQDSVTAGMRRDPQEQPVNTIQDIIEEAAFIGRQLRLLSEDAAHLNPTEVNLLSYELERRVLWLCSLTGRLSAQVDQTLKKIKKNKKPGNPIDNLVSYGLYLQSKAHSPGRMSAG